MENYECITEIESKISRLRKHMIYIAQLKGINHSDTIKCSQELDFYLTQYQKIKVAQKQPL